MALTKMMARNDVPAPYCSNGAHISGTGGGGRAEAGWAR